MYVLAGCCFVLALLVFKEAARLLRGEFANNPIVRDLDMTRRTAIARFYFLVTMVFGADLLFLATQLALFESAPMVRRRFFQFLVVAVACLLVSHVLGRYWFRRR